MQPETADFPSGEWTGFFLERHQLRRGWMHLYLHFSDGKIEGEGTDYVGPWHIRGTYDQNSGQVSWVKQYLGKHSVSYNGLSSDQGIRGEWDINDFLTGAFHIWPKTMREVEQFYLENEIDLDGTLPLHPVPIDDPQSLA